MNRWWMVLLLVALLGGCGQKVARMEHPEDPEGRYHEQIAVARHVLETKEQWADRVEWEVVKLADGWKVTAWRIEFPERKGPARYLPWGCSIIELDSRMVPTHYHSKG
jgi:hypothetical protein